MRIRPNKLTIQQQINQFMDEIDLLETLSWNHHIKGDNLKAFILDRVINRLHSNMDSLKVYQDSSGSKDE
jgi:hypothetical protein